MSNVNLQEDNWAQGLGASQKKALSLLGQGISSVMVASTLGVSESLISQFLAEPRFAEEVTQMKLRTLQKQTNIDNKYMESEEKLVDKLLKVIPMMTKPMDILRGLQVVNATKRRGMAEVATSGGVTQIVQINLPAAMAARFITNGQNQIVEIEDEQGARSLITSTPQAVDRFAAETIGERDITAEIGWEGSTSSDTLFQQASERLQESGVPEAISKGLRRSLENKGQITADDL